MAIFDKANLVMIPSQYKDGKLYNIKPEDQSGAFEFERGSSATRVNSDGLIERVEPLNQDVEVIVNGSFTGGSTGWVLTTSWSYDVDRVFFDKDYNRIDNLIQVNQSWTISQGKQYRLSFDIENVDQNDLAYIFIRIVDVAGTGVQDIGNSYQYYNDGTNTIVFSPVADSTRIDFYARGNVSGNSGGSFYIDNVSIKEVQGNTPRIDYSGTEPALLLEPQRTNEVTYSEDFSQWSNLGTRVAFEHNTTDTLSPEGKYNATKLTKNISGNPTLRLSTITSGNPYVFSCWAKAGTSDKIVLDISDVDNTTFTLTDEWQRFEVTTNSAANNWVDIELRTDAEIGSYVYVWGAQAEQGSYATSYISTNGTTETRLADVCYGGGDASVFNDSEGTLYLEYEPEKDLQMVSLSNGTSAEAIWLYLVNSGTSLSVFVNTGGGQVASINCGTYESITANSGVVKVAATYKSNRFKAFLNGSLIATDTSGTTPNGLNVLEFKYPTGSAYNTKAKIRALYYFPEELTDTQLQELTTI